MTKRVINQVRDYLTIVTEDRTYEICPVEMLLWRHTPEQVVGFLNQLRQEYKKELRELLRENKSHPKVNFLIVNIFRLRMAIKTIQRAQKEANRENQNEAEQGTAGSGGLS